ncbi:hypothetical protein QZH44_15465 [Pseudomonas corrugata]|nr:hypothetical protein [Pseudomonas corrugata]MDU9037666.1 hypothetical protein [Pseudomonas corrugata]MDU9039039.1 hypothetical protein [Pseudomonas corrugata]
MQADLQVVTRYKLTLISKYELYANKILVLLVLMCDKSQPLQTLEQEGWK